MGFIQYLKDTRGELYHVAWPTRTQTIVYTIMVIGLSVFVALYLGFFDFIFTTGLARGLQFLPQHPASSVSQTASTTTNDIVIDPSIPTKK